MPVIALIGNKGGAGKTTLAINLASALTEMSDTILLDADPQGSVLHWHAMTDGQCGLSVADASMGVSEALADAERFRYRVVDCPPSVQSPQTQAALRSSDMVVIPVQPSPLDLWASAQIEEEIEQARIDNHGLRALLLINQMEPRTRLSQVIRGVLEELNLQVANCAIRRRVAYRNAVLQGKSVLQLGSRAAEAEQEIRELSEEVVKLL